MIFSFHIPLTLSLLHTLPIPSLTLLPHTSFISGMAGVHVFIAICCFSSALGIVWVGVSNPDSYALGLISIGVGFIFCTALLLRQNSRFPSVPADNITNPTIKAQTLDLSHTIVIPQSQTIRPSHPFSSSAHLDSTRQIYVQNPVLTTITV